MSYALLNAPPKLDEMTKRGRNIRSICWEVAQRRFPNNKEKRYKFFDIFYELALAYSRVIQERIHSKELRVPLIRIGSLRPYGRKFNDVTTIFALDKKGLVPPPVKPFRMKLAKNEVIVIKNDGSEEALNAIATVVRSQRKYRVRFYRGTIQIDNDFYLNVRIPVNTYFVSLFPGMYFGLSAVELFEHFRHLREEPAEYIPSPPGLTADDLPDNLEMIDEALELVDWFKKENTKEIRRENHAPLNPLFRQVEPSVYKDILMNPAYPSKAERNAMFETLGYKKTMELLYLMKRGFNVDVNLSGINEEAITDYLVSAGYTEEQLEKEFETIEEELSYEDDDVDLENFNFEE